MRGDRYQIILIALGVVATALFGVFFYRELFPEYKIYQNAYLELEEFRTTYTGQPMPPFKGGVKQIVLEPIKNGPVEIDRCTSCHVALQFQHFSPTQVVTDINGNIVYDEDGIPKKEKNPEYIWHKLDEKIADLTNPESSNYDPSAAEKYQALKTAEVGEHTYSMPKVLQMHPLIGRETRPFEFHPIDEYGCTSCHSGNGRGLTTQKAHGPVFDGDYEVEDIGPVPQFTEPDPENDPRFARIFNAKPGHELLFQTTPILIGPLMEAKCVQCHQTSKQKIEGASRDARATVEQWKDKSQVIQKSYDDDLNALVDLIRLRNGVYNNGVRKTVDHLKEMLDDYTLTPQARETLSKQATFLTAMVGGPDGLRPENYQAARDVALKKLEKMIADRLGSESLAKKLLSQSDTEGVDTAQIVRQFMEENQDHPEAEGDLFKKARTLKTHDKIFKRIGSGESAVSDAVLTPEQGIKTDIDWLTENYQEGERLFISQACYPCHRIAGFSRGGVGPDLTEIGKYYPWYIKESIVWPQADLKTSTMPNYRLDHEQLEDLVTFLLAQRGRSKAVSESAYKTSIAEWEEGRKLPWEKPVSPAEMHDLDFSMTVFATEGCAACHRLRGFQSNVGFAVEKENGDFDALYKEREWFRRTIPELASGSDLVAIIEKHAEEIDSRIVDNVRENSLIERIDAKFPGNTESFYSNFAYARRAKNTDLQESPAELKIWKERVHRLLMMYVQEYGYGRLVGPKPNWSGVYRTDEWLMEHFKKPTALVARSIMPVFPFDESKFYALTHMLDVLGARNRDEDRKVWDARGFNPAVAYDMYCAQCHGNQRIGNGPISEWIYPVPKNLRNADFMRNLTPARAKDSIVHGIKGGPMPPWGEAPKKPATEGVPVLTEVEIDRLVDWLYSGLPGRAIFEDEENIPKWKYQPEDVLEELEREGTKLPPALSFLPSGYGYFAATNPEVTQVFDVEKNGEGSPDPYSYYIKKRFYTEENLEEGQAYFELHCAVCHGREGDGAGLRAGVMVDAKPRMLTNLDWIETRDDMRLLRSIKYGVTGTSMQPWGDQTTALQRLQLVMYIRTLSAEQKMRDALYTTLYQSFDEARFVIDNARINEFPDFVALNRELETVTKERQETTVKVRQGQASPEEAAELYKKQLELSNRLDDQEKVDRLLKEIKQGIEKEKRLFEEIGLGLIAQDEALVPVFLKLVNEHGDAFSLVDGKLQFKSPAPNSDYRKEIVKELDAKLEAAKQERNKVSGRIASVERSELLKDLESQISGLEKLKLNLLSGLEQVKEIHKRQEQRIKELNEIT